MRNLINLSKINSSNFIKLDSKIILDFKKEDNIFKDILINYIEEGDNIIFAKTGNIEKNADNIFTFNLIGIKGDASRISGFFGDEWILGSFIFHIVPVILLSVLFYENISHKVKNLVVLLIMCLSILIIYFIACSKEKILLVRYRNKITFSWIRVC